METIKSINNEVQIDVHPIGDDGTVDVNIISSAFGVHATFDHPELLRILGGTDAKALAEHVRRAKENTRQIGELRTRTAEISEKVKRLQDALDRLLLIWHRWNSKTKTGPKVGQLLAEMRSALDTAKPFNLPTKAGVRFEAHRIDGGALKRFTTLEGADQPYYLMEGWGGGFLDEKGVLDTYDRFRLLEPKS